MSKGLEIVTWTGNHIDCWLPDLNLNVHILNCVFVLVTFAVHHFQCGDVKFGTFNVSDERNSIVDGHPASFVPWKH